MGHETLKEARKAAGYTQQEMAEKLGVSRPKYQLIERDPTTATVAQAKVIAILLSRNYERLFFGPEAN